MRISLTIQHMAWKLLAVVSTAVLVTLPAHSDSVIYGSSSADKTLVQINLTAMSASTADVLSVATRAIDVDTVDNKVYFFEWGVDSDEIGYWDQPIGLETQVRQFPASPQKLITSMALSPAGDIYVVDDQQDIFRIEKDDGSAQLIANFSGTLATAQDIAFSPTATLYMVAEDDIYTINVSTIVASPLFSNVIVSDPNVELSGVSYCDGMLYISDTNTNTGSSSLYSVDPVDGTTTYLMDLGVQIDDLSACIDLDLDPNNAPEAYDDNYSVNEDMLLSVPVAGVLANDNDLDGDALTAQLVTDAAMGDLTLNDDGSFTYQPDQDFSGVDSFTYQVNDGRDLSVIATVSLTVDAVNDAPVAQSQSVNVFENSSVAITLSGSDIEQSPLSYAVIDAPLSGDLIGVAPNLTYLPDTDFVGNDSFTFTVNDGELESSAVTVSIVVTEFNNAPDASADNYATVEDNLLVVDAATGVLFNDSDLDGDSLTAVLVTQPSHGVLTLNVDGSFSYQPESNYAGVDSFSYTANDAALASAETIVSINVVADNDAPLGTVDSYELAINGALDIAAPGVLANDSDIENDVLTAELLSDAAGDLVLNQDGSFTYTPLVDFVGNDSFSYRSFDGNDYSAETTVTLTIDAGEDVIIYGSNRLGDMIEINITANSYQYVAPLALGTQAMEQDFSTEDALVYYFELGFDADQFMSWNPQTGENFEIVQYGTSPGKYGKRMAIAPDGVMYVMDSDDALYILDKSNGDASFLGVVDDIQKGDLGGTGDFAFAPDGTLYLMTYQHLYILDLATLETTEIASDMFADEAIEGIEMVWTGVAYCDGMIYASHAEVETEISALYAVNPTTGATTRLYEFDTYLNDLSSCSAITE